MSKIEVTIDAIGVRKKVGDASWAGFALPNFFQDMVRILQEMEKFIFSFQSFPEIFISRVLMTPVSILQKNFTCYD